MMDPMMSSTSITSTASIGAAETPLGIFWDIENCPIPLTKSASGVANRIRQFVRQTHPECGFAKEFVCCCDSKRLSDSIADGLNRNGVIVAHVNSSAKNAADDKLSELMDSFVDNFGHSSPVLVVITGDINFAKTIRNAIRKSITVVLIHNNYCSQDLKNLVKESYLFDAIIADVPKAHSDDRLKPTHIKVCNLPTDKPIKDIITRLSQMTSNCGGKPMNFFDGKALIEFGCRDDAIRALHRISGDNCFGHEIQCKLIDNLKTSTETQEFNICKSIITGLSLRCSDNVTQVVHKMIAKWEDFNINSKHIVRVDVLKDNVLMITAATPEANQKLLKSAKNHLKTNPSVKWTEMEGYELVSGFGWSLKIQEPIADNRRSVIKGFKSRKEDNVLENIKSLVNSWNDRKVCADFVVSVERNTKQQLIDGKVNLFVTAVSAEASKALVRAAKYHLNPNSGIKWKRYKHMSRNVGEDLDDYNCKSVIKGLVTRSGENLTEMVCKIVDDWDDNSVTGNSIVRVETNSRQRREDGDQQPVNLFVTAINPKASQALVMGAKRHIRAEHKIKWTKYTPRDVSRSSEAVSNYNSDESDSDLSESSFYSTSSSAHLNLMSNASKTMPQNQDIYGTTYDNSVPNCLSIITGLKISCYQNAVKTVRKLVFSWSNSKINGNFIVKVEPQWRSPPHRESIPALIVTASSPHRSKALIAGANMHLKPSEGITWTEYKPQQNGPQLQRQALTRNYMISTPNVSMNQMNGLAHYQYWQSVPVWQFLPLQAPLPLIQPTVQTLPHNNVNLSPQTISSIPSTSTSNRSIKAHNICKTDDNIVSNSRMSVIRGLFTKADDDITKIVRREVMNWRESRTNGNFIEKVERDSRYLGIDGKVPLYVTAKCAKSCKALISCADKLLDKSKGIVWTHVNARHESSSPQDVASSHGDHQSRANHPNRMFVICGHSTNHTDDVLLMVRQLITCFDSSEITAEDIVAVTRDYKYRSRDGSAMLFVTAKDVTKKRLILEMTKSLDSKLAFKDYIGFKH